MLWKLKFNSKNLKLALFYSNPHMPPRLLIRSDIDIKTNCKIDSLLATKLKID